jgi:hypothetical protein
VFPISGALKAGVENSTLPKKQSETQDQTTLIDLEPETLATTQA